MPSNFYWLLENRIAGMGCPGSYSSLPEDMAFLKKKGIDVIISLTVEPLSRSAGEGSEFEFFHIPIVDGASPTIPQVESFINYLNYALSSGKRAVVHCGAGYGRTGTMFACYLVSLGYAADLAICEMRKKKPAAIENKAQERRVSDYAKYLKEKSSRSSEGKQ